MTPNHRPPPTRPSPPPLLAHRRRRRRTAYTHVTDRYPLLHNLVLVTHPVVTVRNV